MRDRESVNSNLTLAENVLATDKAAAGTLHHDVDGIEARLGNKTDEH